MEVTPGPGSESRRYLIPQTRHQTEVEIEKSRFITVLQYAPDVATARALIDEMRATYPGANHHCWAYLIGPPGSTSQVGMSDDGEPHGTAGKPMLNVLVHSDIGDVAAVVTRFFGGKKLGKGGLVRAYGGCLKQTLETCVTKEKKQMDHWEVVIPYDAVTPFQRILPQYEVEIEQEQFAQDATYHLALPCEWSDPFEKALNDLTGGAVLMHQVHSKPEARQTKSDT